VSEAWGYDRGTPVDRYYIERFLQTHRRDIRGAALEVKELDYLLRFGANVDRMDVLDVDPANAAATVVADLAAADPIPSDSYDCVVLTQTLQYILDVAAAVAHTHRILAPGGVVLATVPSITRVTDDVPGLVDYWRFTEASARALFAPSFTGDVQVESFGNLLTASAFLAGLAAEELTPRELAAKGPRYPVVVTIRAQKA
jgi:SAM-dependent methyltransferase